MLPMERKTFAHCILYYKFEIYFVNLERSVNCKILDIGKNVVSFLVIRDQDLSFNFG